MTTARAGAVQEPRVFEAIDSDGDNVQFKMSGKGILVCWRECNGPLWLPMGEHIKLSEWSPAEIRAIADCLDHAASTGAGLGEGKES